MKRIVLGLLFMFSFSFGSGIVGSSNILDVIKNLELKNSDINAKKIELEKSGITDFSKDKVINLMNKEKDTILKNALELFKSKKAYATLNILYKKTKEDYIANIADNKKKHSNIAYIYRDKLLLVNLELDNDLILTIDTINSLLESSIDDKVYKSYLEGAISTIKSNKYKDISKFVIKNNDKKIKKFTDVEKNYNKFILKKISQIEFYDYLLNNVDKLNSKDIVLDTFHIFSLSDYINNKSRDFNLYFEINILKYFIETEIIVNPAKIVLILFTLFFGIFIFKIVSFLIKEGFVKVSSTFSDNNTHSKIFSNNLINSVDKPLKWFYSTIVLFILFKILFSPSDLPEYIGTLFSLSHLFTFVWVAWRLISNYEEEITEEIRRKQEDITTEAVLFGVLTFKILLSIIFIGSFITLAIPSIINYFAGAGFLIAFILKDNVSDYFDAFKIIKEPNVQIGHWILLPLLKDLEGVVHKIGIWNTTIIMFDQSTITIPNSSLVKTIIRNFSRRIVRQIKFNFYLPLKLDSETILKIVNDVNKMLMEHPNLMHKEDVKGKPKDIRERGISGTCFARWVSSENGVRILVYTNTNKDDWMFQLETQENIQAQIKDICRKNGTDIVMKDDFIDISKIEAYKTIMDTRINKEN